MIERGEPASIGRRKRLATTVYSLLLFLVFGSLDLSACSYSSFPTKIGRDFLVEVFNQGKPVQGLQIELSTDPGSGDEESRIVSIVTTDANGWAKFVSVRPRLYYIQIKHPAYGSSEELLVMRHPPKSSPENIMFEWPGVKPLSTQSVSGLLNGRVRTERELLSDLSHPTYSPVRGAKLTLSKAVTNEIVDWQMSQESGSFSLQSVPAGLYFLRVERPNTSEARWLYPPDGYVAIQVDPSAKLSSLNLFLDNAICGALAIWNEAK